MKKEKLFTGFLAAFTGLLVVGLIFLAGCKKHHDVATVTVATTAVADINTTTATGGGTIVGAATVTERGVCWSENHNPTTSGQKATSGDGVGTYTVSITGLFNTTTYYAKAYAKTGDNTIYGEEVTFTTSAPIEMIANGDFSLPDDVGITEINSIGTWKTDETDAGIIGRSQEGSEYIVWEENNAKSFYQTVGIVPSVQTDYNFSFDGRFDWTYWEAPPQYHPKVAVIFSTYSGGDPTTRVAIDTVKIQWDTDYSTSWAAKTGSYTLTAEKATASAGKNLVIEFDVLNALQADGYTGYDDSQVWFSLDKLSVKQQ